jgi:hypothetical protein
MNTIINNYGFAVAEGNTTSVAATFATNVKVMPPASNQSLEGIGKAATMLSAAASAIDGFKLVRSFEPNENWAAIVFEGTLDGTTVQLLDQVHLDENGLIDHVDVFLRPTAMAGILLPRMAAAIEKLAAA